jgi:hypothetical protein
MNDRHRESLASNRDATRTADATGAALEVIVIDRREESRRAVSAW